jgi:predicted RNase H-like nuclease (RuvC/YqgF family)
VEGKIARKEARIERYEGYSENAEARASAASSRATSILSIIPPGQPILVGHHSERRHRRGLEKADNAMRKSVEESKKVEHYDYKVRSLGYEISRARESRKYLENRLKDAKKELRKLEGWAKVYLDQKNHENLQPRITQAKEKVAYWEKRLEERENEIRAEGGQVASPENIRPGDLVRDGQWYPVVRVNRNTVTVSHWLGVPTLTYKLEYRRITEFRTPNKT